MLMILIEHPDHGRMHVYDNNEYRRHELLGWRKVNEPKQLEQAKNPEQVEKTKPKQLEQAG